MNSEPEPYSLCAANPNKPKTPIDIYLRTQTSTPTKMPPPLTTIPSAACAKLHVYNGHQDIHIGDIHTAASTSTSASSPPMTAGFFTVRPGCSATTTFPFAEYKYVVAGSFVLTDVGNAGAPVKLKAGDVFYIPMDSTIRFECEGEEGKAFFVAGRELNAGRRAGLVEAKL